MKIKRAETDFTADGLPHNRLQLFFDCLKIRHRLFFAAGGILLLFALPLLVLLLTHDATCAKILADSAKSYEDKAKLIFYNDLYFGLGNIVGYVVFGLGLSGTARVLRQLTWGEGIFFGRDFVDGVKLNGGAYAIVFAFVGIVRFICSVMNAATANGFFWAVIKYMPLVLSVFLLAPVALLLLAEVAVYKSKLLRLVKNAVLMYLQTLPSTFLATLCALLPFVGIAVIGAFAVPVYTKTLFVTLYVVLLLPVTQFGELLYCNMLFDKFINVEFYPEMVDKGVRRNKDD